ncbi:MAG TPA: hypothetical protein VKR22_08395, partial [Acidimicrobiales bacterium]|nr:hypothetical protein [Acidimicrobiales bacterium]
MDEDVASPDVNSGPVAGATSDPTEPGTGPAHTTRPPRALLIMLAGGVAVMVALSATLVVVLGTTNSAEATVVDSVQSTLADRTAHVSLDLEVGTAGHEVTATGTGAIDFTQNALDLQVG